MVTNDNDLAENQRIIFHARRHWAVLLGPLFFIFIGWLTLRSKVPQSIALSAFGFIWGLFSYFQLRNFDIVLTDNQLLIHAGFQRNRSYLIPLDTITGIDYYQPSLGAMLNFGKIIIIHGGTKKNVFRFIARPAELIKEVQEAIIAARREEKPFASKN
jgi:uncharacterized membrane protein YdbT with pleckstrin-like domain